MSITCPDILPYALSEDNKNISIVNFNYTNQDFWSMKTRLVNFINEQFSDDFNDFVESSLAIMETECFAFLADTLSFKIDQVANEIFIDTVTELDNAFRLAKLVGFEPTPPIASRSLWSGTLSGVAPINLIISTPHQIQIAASGGTLIMELYAADSNNNVLFDEDIIIPAGATSVTSVIGLQGETRETSFTATGEVGQTLSLTDPNITYDSIKVYIEGSAWERVEYFTDSQPRKEFRVEYNSDYSAWIIFGNNRAGLIPSLGTKIAVTYRIGEGTRGNIVSQVTQQSSIPISEYPYYLPITWANYTKGEYGYDGDTLEDIRRKLPEYLRTQDRAVTGPDYKTVADQFASPYHGQVGKSVASLRNYGCAANIIDLYILAKDGDNLAEASPELKADLLEEMEVKKMFSDFVCVRDGVILEVDVNIDLTVSRLQRKFQDEIKTRVLRRLDAFFNLVNWEYGQDLKDIDIIKTLADINEILTTDINFTTDDPNNSGQTVTTKFYEIIRPDTIEVSFVYI